MILALRKANVDALTARQKRLLVRVLESMDIGDPARWETSSGVVWLLSADPRIPLRDVAYLGRFCALLGTVPEVSLDDADPVKIRGKLRAWLGPRVVWPVAGDATAVLAANGAPVWVRAGMTIPAGLTPVQEV